MFPFPTLESVWVLLPDYGAEGLQAPFMAFLTQEKAEQAKKLIESAPSYQALRLCEVPVWKE